jgi:two-component sensor histidine kinase
MSLVHEKLYQSRDLSKIDLAVYIQSLAAHLFNVYLTDSNRIRLETDFEEIPLLDINSAVPCGLILNELISNSLKHAFPEGRKGLIRIGLKQGPDDVIILRVADDGIGFPKDFDFRQSEGLGFQIVNLLVGQLDAAIDLDRTNGTAFTVTFRELKYAPRI